MRIPGLFRLFFGGRDENEQTERKADDEYELVAVIAAAVQEYMKAGPEARLKIVSIKRTGQTAPVWNRAGRLDRIFGKL